MHTKKIAVYAALMILAISGIFPLASINEIPVTMLPIYENFSIGGEIWIWRNISAFVMTHYLALIVGIFLALKKNEIGIIVIGVIFLINTFFVLIAVWMSQLDADMYKDIAFSFEWGWIFILIGIGLTLYSGIKTRKN